VVVSLLTSPFVVGLAAFYLLVALPGPFLVRLVLCVGLVVGGLVWRRSDRTAAAPSGAGWAEEVVWPGDHARAPAAPAAPGGAGWTVTRRPDRWEGGPDASTQEAPALPGRAGELQLVAVLVNQTGQQAELHLAPGMANLPVAVLARQAAGLLAAEQGDTGWRLEWLVVVDPARASQPSGLGAQMPWGWGG
jgi:hypothetical protein